MNPGRAISEAFRQRPGRGELASRAFGLDMSDPDSLALYFHRLEALNHLVVTAEFDPRRPSVQMMFE